MNYNLIRKLARSNKYQLLYGECKELGSLKLFENGTKLTNVQMQFLHWLRIYDSLYLDLATGEEYISESVIEHPIRCEAYLLLRNEKRKKERLKTPNMDYKNKSKETTSGGLPTVIFNRDN